MSTIDQFRKIRKEVAAGTFKPIYFLHGEESFFIDRLANEIEHHALQEHERDFNLTVLYGKDTDPGVVADTCLRFPMMAERQVVVLREAQAWRIEAFDKLVPYFNKPTPTTVLVICYNHKKADGRKTWLKELAKQQVVFVSDKLKEQALPEWIRLYASSHKRRIAEREARLLADHLGSDLGKLTNEVEKLCLVTGDGATLDGDLIERYVGISKEFNGFELQKAIGEGNHYQAQRIAQGLSTNKDTPIFATLGLLNNYFTKLGVVHSNRGKSEKDLAAALKVSPYFLKDYTKAAAHFPPVKLQEIQRLLREADLKSKGLGATNADGGELLRELVAKVMRPVEN